MCKLIENGLQGHKFGTMYIHQKISAACSSQAMTKPVLEVVSHKQTLYQSLHEESLVLSHRVTHS